MPFTVLQCVNKDIIIIIKLRHNACELLRDLLNSRLTKSAVAVNVGFIARVVDLIAGSVYMIRGCLAGW